MAVAMIELGYITLYAAAGFIGYRLAKLLGF